LKGHQQIINQWEMTNWFILRYKEIYLVRLRPMSQQVWHDKDHSLLKGPEHRVKA
jgi:hypothetical protein